MSAILSAARGKAKPPEKPENGDYALEVGDRIVRARREQNMKQVELAELVKVSQRSMQAYENGEVIPYRKMKELAEVLGVSTAWILHGEDAAGDEAVRLLSIERQLEELTQVVRTLTRKLK